MFTRDEELYVVRSTRQRPGLSVAELLACSCHVRLIYFRYRPDCQISAVSCPQNLTRDRPASHSANAIKQWPEVDMIGALVSK